MTVRASLKITWCDLLAAACAGLHQARAPYGLRIGLAHLLRPAWPALRISHQSILRLALRTIAALLIAVPLTGGAHEDVVEGPHGVEDVQVHLQGQGRNAARDRAYAWWAQYDDATTEILTAPKGKGWLTVAEAIPYAKRVWGVNIVDESNDPGVGELRFAMGFGAVEREMALPLFLQALSLAVEARPGCYVQADERGGFDGSFKRYHKQTVYLRRARPLQADWDHPWDTEKAARDELDARQDADNSMLEPAWSESTEFERNEMDFQDAVAQLLDLHADGEIGQDELLKQYRALRWTNRHTRRIWISRYGDPNDEVARMLDAMRREAARALEEKRVERVEKEEKATTRIEKK